jgi:hypothetical protein
LAFEQYEGAFRENAINEKMLPNLTAEDLKDLGVGIVGHRRMLLDAIALLRADASEKAPAAEASSTPSKRTQDTAERRQVAVMFLDLVARQEWDHGCGTGRPALTRCRIILHSNSAKAPVT